MVGEAADFDQVPLLLPNDPADVFVESLDEFVSNGVASVSGAENDVIGEFGERSHGCCRRFAACG